MPTIITTYIKRATFADGYAALEDKQRLYDPELLAELDSNFTDMIDRGIITSKPIPEWDQDNFILKITVPTLVTAADYREALTVNMAKVREQSRLSGWTWVDTLIVE